MTLKFTSLTALLLLQVPCVFSKLRGKSKNGAYKNARGLRSYSKYPIVFDHSGPSVDSVHHRIVGGDQVSGPGAYPFFVSWDGSCGGSLIYPDIVLSAAHCNIIDSNGVVVNAYRLDDATTDGSEGRVITERSMHPEYDDDTLVNDFILLKLDQPVLNFDILPITLNKDPSIPAAGQDIKVIGLGTTSSGGDQPEFLREVTVTTTSDDFCDAEYGSYGGIVTDVMFCANGDGKDSCQGDSGGPIFTVDPVTGDFLEQVGVVSWGFGCADPSFPGVYAEISAVTEWIDSEICRLSSVKPANCPPTPAPLPCIDSPEGWYDIDGPVYNCQWYVENNACTADGDNYENFGKTANQACCACGGGETEEEVDETAVPTPSPTTTLPTMSSLSSECIDNPVDWYDADGPEFNCEWYEQKSNCMLYGNSFANFGKTANEACCVCQGEMKTGTDDSTTTSLTPSASPTSTSSQQPSQTPTAGCADYQGWHDADGPTFNCEWYQQKSNCALYGNDFEEYGMTANEACCACGGGF